MPEHRRGDATKRSAPGTAQLFPNFRGAVLSAVLLGEQLALLDDEGTSLDTIFRHATTDTAFARGYLYQLLRGTDPPVDRVKKLLDELEEETPARAFELFTVGGMARRFLDHSMQRVRQWAQLEVRQAQLDAQSWREMEDELTLR